MTPAKKNIYFSIRSKSMSEAGANAEKIAKSLGGSGGGHGKIGAGRVPFKPKLENQTMEMFIKLFKQIFRIEDKKPEKILKNV